MARPKKQTVDYFPHYVNSGKTLYILESSFGNGGYAFWFKLLELLGTADGHFYDCRNTPSWRFLLAKTKVSEDIANNILDTLAELEAIDGELWEKRIIWSENFVQNLLPVYSNRKSSLPKKPVIEGSNGNKGEFLPVETPASEVSTPKNTQSKVKESKVKKSKVNESDNSHSDEAIEICKYFEQLLPGQSIASHLATLKIFIEQYGYGWTKEALQKTVSSKGKFIKAYMEKILQNWQSEGKEETTSGGTGQDNEASKNEQEYDFSCFGT